MTLYLGDLDGLDDADVLNGDEPHPAYDQAVLSEACWRDECPDCDLVGCEDDCHADFIAGQPAGAP